MNGLGKLTVASSMREVATALDMRTELSSVRGMVLWERSDDGALTYAPPNHHTLSLYRGGGNGTWSREARRYGFGEAVCVLPEGYATHWDHTGYVKNLHIYFSQKDLEQANWAPARSPQPEIFTNNPRLTDFASLLTSYLGPQRQNDAFALDHLLIALLSQLAPGEPTRANGLSNAQLRHIETRLSCVEQRPTSVSMLAQDLGISPRHLTRLYKITTGKTLTQGLRHHQIKRAKTLLSGPSPLSEIALRCGFASQSHFTTIFRRETGHTPRAYRALL